jgi:hypothetical protein
MMHPHSPRKLGAHPASVRKLARNTGVSAADTHARGEEDR